MNLLGKSVSCHLQLTQNKHVNILLHRNQMCDFIPFRILQVLLSPFSANHIQQSLFHRKGEQTRTFKLSTDFPLLCFVYRFRFYRFR